MAYNSPKAAHFEAVNILSGEPAPPTMFLEQRWELARKLERNGITCLLNISPAKRQAAQRLIDDFNCEIPKEIWSKWQFRFIPSLQTY